MLSCPCFGLCDCLLLCSAPTPRTKRVVRALGCISAESIRRLPTPCSRGGGGGGASVPFQAIIRHTHTHTPPCFLGCFSAPCPLTPTAISIPAQRSSPFLSHLSPHLLLLLCERRDGRMPCLCCEQSSQEGNGVPHFCRVQVMPPPNQLRNSFDQHCALNIRLNLLHKHVRSVTKGGTEVRHSRVHLM